MALFRRNKIQQNTIPELQEYYNAERRERSGLSWLLALVSVACAGLLFIGLVFGGKWLYRKLADNLDKDKSPTAQTENQSTNQPATPADADTTDTTIPTESSDSGAVASAPATSTPASTSPSTSTPASTTTTPTTSSTSSSSSAASSALPHTGPAGTMVVVATTALGATVVRYTLFKRKLN